MITLKNPFSKSTAPTDPPETVDKAWGAYMTASRAWKTKTAELADAESSLAQLDRSIGEKNADGVDASGEVLARQSAHSLVTQLESAVAVLLQRKQEAEANWTHAKHQASDAATAAARARVLALALRGEGIFTLVKQFRTDLSRDTEDLRVTGGNEEYSYVATEITAQFDLFLGIANRPPAADAADSGAYRKYPNWTACVEAFCGPTPRM